MNELKNLTEILLDSYAHLVKGISVILPLIFAGLLLFLVGWLTARLLSWLIVRSLRLLRFDKMMNQLKADEFLERIKWNRSPSEIVGKLFYWLIMLLLFVGFSDALGMDMVSEKIGDLINYIPNLIIAALILIVGLYLAGRLQALVQTTMSSHGVKAGNFISNLLFYLLTLFVVLTALEQLQFNIDLLTANVMILLGGIALAFAIGYGLAAKEIFPHIISSYYNKSLFHVGDRIRLADTEGVILELTNLSVVIATAEGKRYIPAKKLITEEVEILTQQ
jgi:hypothetical protein